MIEVQPVRTVNAEVTVPGSKSYTHRLLIASALSDGPCTVRNALRSEDTNLTLAALSRMGADVREEGDALAIRGTGGRLTASDEIYLANSGTSMRLLTAVAALAQGTTVLTGTDRMKERPLQDLLDGLAQIGVDARSIEGNGCPPVRVTGGDVRGGHVRLRCGVSSQYLSGLLLTAPCTRQGMDIEVVQGPVSKPYIDLTLDVMERFGVAVQREGYERFHVSGGQVYRSGAYVVETDASNASYFWAAAAVTGGTVKVRNIHPDSRQGDIRLLDCFRQMGCTVADDAGGITVTGGPLTAIDVDMGDMPDMVPTLAVVAAFAEGTTTIRNVAHLRAKECDRLSAVAAELSRMGADVRTTEDSIAIRGGSLSGAEIETYDDHRIAMCFAVAGLRVPGVRIKDEACVGKSFPGFWDVFAELYPK